MLSVASDFFLFLSLVVSLILLLCCVVALTPVADAVRHSALEFADRLYPYSILAAVSGWLFLLIKLAV